MNRSLSRLAGLTLLLACASSIGVPRAVAQDDAYRAIDARTLIYGVLTDAVVRLDETHLEVRGPGRAKRTRRYVVTVFNEDGRDAARVVLSYDGITRLGKVKGAIYDASGKRIRKMGDADQSDFSAVSGISLYEDNRVRVLSLDHDSYPYTAEFEIEYDHRGLLHYPTWLPQRSEYAVQEANLTVEAPPELGVRYIAQNFPEGSGDLEPMRGTRRTNQTMTWRLTDLPAPENEPDSPAWIDRSPAIFFAATDFEIEGKKGRMDTWENLGSWYYQLAEGRQRLPPSVAGEALAMITSEMSDREKARRLYQFMQERTRYVSVQLGIGGWQPFDAIYVGERGYGDCKALTNYMQALLMLAGVEAYPALIYNSRSRRPVRPQFPSSTFNHVILMVPLEEAADDGSVFADTLWLESTSQTIPFGHIGAGNEGQHALIAKPTGSHLARTPHSSALQNRQDRTADVALSPSGAAMLDVTTRYTGNQQDYVRQIFMQATPRERDERLRRSLDLTGFEVESADYSEVEAGGLSVELPMRLSVQRYAARVGKRLFVPLAPVERWTYVPEADTARTQPILFNAYAFLDTDTVRISIPEGYRVEALPEPVVVDAPFGTYRAAASLSDDGSTLIFERHLQNDRSRLEPETFDAYRDAIAAIVRSDGAKAVLVAE